MKSKKVIVGLVILNLMFVSLFISNATSNNPKIQANDDYSLGFKIDDEFEFFCTEFNTTELFHVFGGNWQSDIGSFLWFADDLAPTDLGEKAKFAIVNITDHPIDDTWWQFIIDGWSWIEENASYGIPALNDVTYDFPKNISGEMWDPTNWIISLPVVLCLSELSFGVGYNISENVVIYAGSNVHDYFVNWIYDENTGIVKNFKIKNVDDTTIFELISPTTAPSKDEIPGYSLYILISTIVLLISFISIILIKKIELN